jgi:hypothetical protein
MFGLGIPSLPGVMCRIGKVEIPLLLGKKLPSPSVSVDVTTFMKDNSGITLLGEAAQTTGGAVRDVFGVLTSPFRSDPTPGPVPTPR